MTPITLIDGSIIQNPAGQPATAAQCLPYICGADASNADAILWCSESGHVGALTCNDPSCQPWVNQIPGCHITESAVPGTPAAVAAPPMSPVSLTPQNIVQPLPNLTDAVAPLPMVSDCGPFDALNGMIAANPVVAVLALFGLAALLWRKS